MKGWIWVIAMAVVASAIPGSSRASEIGHYVPGLLNIRDFYVPDPGFYGIVYNYIYTTDRLNDRHGDKVRSLTIAPRGGPGVTADVNLDVDIYALAPAIIWVSNWKPLGAKYGVQIAPTFADASIEAQLSVLSGRGGKAETSSFDVGDLFVEPVWLGWTLQHFDFAFAYAFYAPTGSYDTDTRTIPGTAVAVKTEDPDNKGYGFWTQQLQGAAAWYPFVSKGTAVSLALTYENHQNKKNFDIEPGDDLTLNWGISQYLPLSRNQHLLLEIGPSGYDSWQITDDDGRDANGIQDQVHAVGGQIGLTYVPGVFAFNFHGLHEFSSEDRFQGDVFMVSAAKKF